MTRHRGDRVLGRRAYSGVLVIPCCLNEDYCYWLLVDTGAAITMLSHRVVEEMGLDWEHPLRQERIASVHQVVWAPVVSLASLQVGSQWLSNVEVLVLSLPAELRVDGVLGVNFLERFRPTFEFEQAVLVLRQRAGEEGALNFRASHSV